MNGKMKTGIVIILSIGMIAIFSLLKEYPTGAASTNGEPEMSTIGGIPVDDLESEDIRKSLDTAISDWAEQSLVITDGESLIELNGTEMQFDIESTLSAYEKETKKKWYEFWKQDEAVHLPIQLFESEEVKNKINRITVWDTEATYNNVMTQAAYLHSGEIEAAVREDLSIIQSKRIALGIQDIPEAATGIGELIQTIDETVVAPGSTFSLIETIGANAELANKEGLNFVASMLYENALYIGAEILERHSQQQIPGYLEPGIEAEVEISAGKDLKFFNRLSNPVMLKLSVEDQQLKAEVYSANEETGVAVRAAKESAVTPRTITRYSNEMAVGQTREVQQGAEGLRVSVYRTIDGIEERVSSDYYPPVNRVLLTSSHQPETLAPTDSDDADLEMDMNGDGLADVEADDPEVMDEKDFEETDENGNPILPPGAYYDKGGNLIKP